MKAHWNMQSYFCIIGQALLILCCVALLAPRPAHAQDGTTDENGRTAAQRALRGAPTPPPPAPQREDPNATCDWDDCSKSRPAPGEVEGLAVSDNARVLSGLLSFQVQASAPANSVYIADDGNIGFGTEAPGGRLHVVTRPGADDAADIFLLDDNGNLEIGGLLSEASSALLKEHFVPIDGQEILDRLATMPITTWNYKTDDATIRHMGPTAQDFYAAFGLGKDDRHIAPLDANGVALAGVQALTQRVQTQATQIATLEAQNAELLQRLQALEAMVQKRDK